MDYTVIGNTLLRVATVDGHDLGLPGRVASSQSLIGALAAVGPSDVDSPTVAFVPEVAEATDQGGLLTLDDDGDFHYLPPIGFTGVDTETVMVTDGEGGMVPVTLRFTVSDMVWYVEDTIGAKNPAGNTDGRSTDAFQTLAAAEAASGAGHTILLFETDAPLDEGITLKSGQKLYGQRVEEEPVSLLPAGLLLEEIADTNARPQVHRTSGAAVTVDTTGGALADVEIRHLDLRSGDNDAISVITAGTNLATGLLITENVIGAAGAHGIDLDSGHTTGEATASIFVNQIVATDDAISVETTAAGVLTVVIDANTNLESTTGRGIEVIETAGTLVVGSFDGNSVSGDTVGDGVLFDSVTFDSNTASASFETVIASSTIVGSGGNPVGGSGLVILGGEGDLDLGDLDVEAAAAGVVAAGTGEVNIGAGTGFRLATGAGSTIVATGGPALDLDPLTASMTLASISSTNSVA
ncbi:MAG: cadherin-like domain-containing protein, partial [Holophagales bacterium]|nr:cadherin-like domain-containing protein [Holophagales bacterium]